MTVFLLIETIEHEGAEVWSAHRSPEGAKRAAVGRKEVAKGTRWRVYGEPPARQWWPKVRVDEWWRLASCFIREMEVSP